MLHRVLEVGLQDGDATEGDATMQIEDSYLERCV